MVDAARALRRRGGTRGVLGKKDRFDRSIAEFSERYADGNERDYAAFTAAIESGRLDARPGV